MACDKLLYFGKAAFRNTLRQTAQATADLAKSEPHRSGRFRLAPAAGMPPPVGIAADRPSGVWPGFPHAPGGDLYFTPFFERAGYWDPEGGGIRRLSELGTGPNPMGGWAPENRCRCSATGRIPGSEQASTTPPHWLETACVPRIDPI